MLEPEPLQQIDRTYVRFRGRKFSYFSGCDYYRLASHGQIVAALTTGLRKYGLNVAASRLTTGNHSLYIELEQKLARFFCAADALLVPEGYMANLVVAQALAGNFSHALLDEKSHSSLVDAASLLNCPVVRFKHRSVEDFACAARRCGPEAKLLLLTDGLFSHNGEVAPLRQYTKVLPKDAVMLIDDAHGAGVVGKTGRGSLEYAGLNRTRVVQTITLSKAFGVYGGAVLGTKALRRRILEYSRIFTGSTPLPLPLANAALSSLRLLDSDKSLRRRLAENCAYVHNALGYAGYSRSSTQSPIVAVLPEDHKAAKKLRRALLRFGIYPSWIRYPGGPSTGYFRFALSSEHTRSQLDNLLSALKEARPTVI